MTPEELAQKKALVAGLQAEIAADHRTKREAQIAASLEKSATDTRATRRGVDPAVARARAKVANACQAGDPERIALARQELAEARAAKLEADARILRSGATPPDRVLLLSSQEPTAPTTELHRLLEQATVAESDEFKREHGHPSTWTDEVRDLWTAMLRRHEDCHSQIGCPQIAFCRSRGDV